MLKRIYAKAQKIIINEMIEPRAIEILLTIEISLLKSLRVCFLKPIDHNIKMIKIANGM
jgi:hypothetical protein